VLQQRTILESGSGEATGVQFPILLVANRYEPDSFTSGLSNLLD
jgi:hypothetical protein